MSPASKPAAANDEVWLVPGVEDIVVHKLTDDAMNVALDQALAQMKTGEMSEEVADFVEALENDETTRAAFVSGMQSRINGYNQDAMKEMAAYQGVEMTRPVTLEEIRQRISAEEGQRSTPTKRL